MDGEGNLRITARKEIWVIVGMVVLRVRQPESTPRTYLVRPMVESGRFKCHRAGLWPAFWMLRQTFPRRDGQPAGNRYF